MGTGGVPQAQGSSQTLPSGVRDTSLGNPHPHPTPPTPEKGETGHTT